MKAAGAGTSSRARVAVLGTSHVATLQFAWSEMGRTHPVIGSMTMFARPFGKGGLRGLVLSGRSLCADDPQLAAWLRRTAKMDTLNIDRYDAFVIHAIGLNPRLACDAARNVCGRQYSEHLLATHADDVRKKAIHICRQTLICRLAADLRSVTEAPVIVTHEPWLSEAHPDCQTLDTHTIRVQQAIQQGMRELCEEMRCDFVPQPASTVTANGFSRAEYQGPDFRHMNAAFGRLMLEEIACRLAPA